MAKYLLVTNDFPPKVGGIQNYLWELWSRQPDTKFVVYTTNYVNAQEFDRSQNFKIIRSSQKFFAPTKKLAKKIKTIAKENNCETVIYDPVWPLGALAKKVGLPYGVIIHGAELVVPSTFYPTRRQISQTIKNSQIVIAAGEYALEQAKKIASFLGLIFLSTYIF